MRRQKEPAIRQTPRPGILGLKSAFFASVRAWSEPAHRLRGLTLSPSLEQWRISLAAKDTPMSCALELGSAARNAADGRTYSSHQTRSHPSLPAARDSRQRQDVGPN